MQSESATAPQASSSQKDGALSVKVVFYDDARRFTWTKDQTFFDLRRHVLNLFGLKKEEDGLLKYVDDEGELVTCMNDQDFEEALRHSRAPHRITLRLVDRRPIVQVIKVEESSSSSPSSSDSEDGKKKKKKDRKKKKHGKKDKKHKKKHCKKDKKKNKKHKHSSSDSESSSPSSSDSEDEKKHKKKHKKDKKKKKHSDSGSSSSSSPSSSDSEDEKKHKKKHKKDKKDKKRKRKESSSGSSGSSSGSESSPSSSDSEHGKKKKKDKYKKNKGIKGRRQGVNWRNVSLLVIDGDAAISSASPIQQLAQNNEQSRAEKVVVNLAQKFCENRKIGKAIVKFKDDAPADFNDKEFGNVEVQFKAATENIPTDKYDGNTAVVVSHEAFKQHKSSNLPNVRVLNARRWLESVAGVLRKEDKEALLADLGVSKQKEVTNTPPQKKSS